MVKFFCFHCGTKIAAEDHWAGQESVCPQCEQRILVPGHGRTEMLVAPPDQAYSATHSVEMADAFATSTSKGGKLTQRRVSDTFAGSAIAAAIVLCLLWLVSISGIFEREKDPNRKKWLEAVEREAMTPWQPKKVEQKRTFAPAKEKANQAAFDAYMLGYKDPDQGDIALRLIQNGGGEEERKVAEVIWLGANDRRKGLPVRFEVIR